MQNYSSIIFEVLNTLITILLPVVAGILLNFLNKKLGREKLLLAKDIISSVVLTLEQQYRSGEIPKDDRFALAIEQGIKRTGLTEEQVAQLVKEAVFIMNVQMNKYDYQNSAPQQSFSPQAETTKVDNINQEVAPVIAQGRPGLLDSLVIPGKE